MTLEPVGPLGLWKRCGRKRRYSLSGAWIVARRIQEQEHKPGQPRAEGPWPYYCETCSGYHVGHERPWSGGGS